MGGHRQGVYNSPAGISYTAEKRTNNKKTKVMTSNKEKIERLKKAMNVLNEEYHFTDDSEKMLKGKIAQAYDTINYVKKLMTKREESTDSIQAQIKFRMPNGTDKYVNKTFDNRKHMRAYIDKVCKQEDCDLDEVWY
jgi:DNA-binding transcriptional regulator GbsR (MarR family)